MPKPSDAPPLAGLHGRSPEPPAWFVEALQHAPRERFHDVEGAPIQTLAWGPECAPGLVLLHGHAAQAHWWSFLAPLLADTRRVVAISWSGMGRSGWRPAYSVGQFAREALSVAEREGLFETPARPVMVAHSFGGVPLMKAVQLAGDRMSGAVLVDALLRPSSGPPRGTGLNRTHPTFRTEPEALQRFRFSPPRPCANLFIADHIARTGLEQVAEGVEAGGHRWSYDPNLWDRLEVEDVEDLVGSARCRLAFIAGANSPIVPRKALAYARCLAAPGTPAIAIPDCGHNVMVDQPLALLAAIQALAPS